MGLIKVGIIIKIKPTKAVITLIIVMTFFRLIYPLILKVRKISIVSINKIQGQDQYLIQIDSKLLEI